MTDDLDAKHSETTEEHYDRASFRDHGFSELEEKRKERHRKRVLEERRDEE